MEKITPNTNGEMRSTFKGYRDKINELVEEVNALRKITDTLTGVKNAGTGKGKE